MTTESETLLRIHFADQKLERLATDNSYHLREFHPEVEKAFRKKLGLLTSAASTRDLREMKSLRLEALKGDRAGQHSMRLNDKWRLILLIHSDGDGQVVDVVEISDYH